MINNPVKKAIESFKQENYIESLFFFERAADIYGARFFEFNINLCEKLISNSQSDFYFKYLKINKNEVSNNFGVFDYLDKVGVKRFLATYVEYLLEGDVEKSKRFLNLIDLEDQKIVTKNANNLINVLQKKDVGLKKNLLIAGHDLRFVQPYIKYLSKYFNITVDKWDGLDLHDAEHSNQLLEKADIVWCEWCCGNAVFYSKNKKKSTKLFVRLHRFEYETSYPAMVDWSVVDSLIFIAEGIKEKVLKRFSINCPTSLLYNSFDVDDFAIKSFKADRDIYSLAMLGFVSKIKRLDLGIDLLDILGSEFKLYLKGKRAEEIDWVWNRESNYFIDQYERIDKAKNIYLEGYDADVPMWVAKKGFLISSSDIEGSHQAVAEAMAAGTIPIIIGKWAFDYKAYEIYPSEFIFDNLNDAANYIQCIIKNNLYSEVSKRVRDFAINNFSVDVVMHSALKLLNERGGGSELIPIDNARIISILTDLNINVVDGSSIWLSSIVDVLLKDKNLKLRIYSKTKINENSYFRKYLREQRVSFVFYADELSDDWGGYFKLYLDNEMLEPSFKTIVRAGQGLTKEIINSPSNVSSKIIYYIVDSYCFDYETLKIFDSLIVQTNFSLYEVKNRINKCGFDKKILVLPPMVPDSYVSEDAEDVEDKKLRIIYTGKLCKDYKSMEMAKFASDINTGWHFDIVASKFYKQDGEDYIRRTKNFLNIGVKRNNLSWIGPISREDVFFLIKKAKLGWLLRDCKFKDSNEISTKLLEYCALGKPVILNRFKSNVDLLGEDYPLYVDDEIDAKKKIDLVKSGFFNYEILSEYCSYVSHNYKMTNAFDRLWGFLYSRKDFGYIEFEKANCGYRQFERYFPFVPAMKKFHLNMRDVDENWMPVKKGDRLLKNFTVHDSKNICVRVQVLFSRLEVGNVMIIYFNNKEISLNGKPLKMTESGRYFEYIKSNNKLYLERVFEINLKNEDYLVDLEISSWKINSEVLVKVELIN